MTKTSSNEQELDENIFYDQVLHRRTLAHRLRVLSMLQTRILNQRLAAEEVTRMHWVVLSCLWQSDGIPVSQISHLLNQVGGSTSEVLDRMEERKLVKRRRARSDRRVCRVYLSKRGAELFAILPDKVLPVTQGLFTTFPEDDKVFFSQAVDRLAANLKKQYAQGEQNAGCFLQLCKGDSLADQKTSELLPPWSVGYRLKVCSQLLTRRFNDLCEPYDISTPQWHILRCLWNEDGLPISVLGDMVEQVGGNLTALLKRLEERGLVLKKQDENDRRCFRIWLCPGAKELFEPTMAVAYQVMKEAFSGFSAAEQLRLSELTERCIQNLNQEQPVADDSFE